MHHCASHTCFSLSVFIHVAVAKIKLRHLIPGPCLQPPGASPLNFWGLTAKFPELSGVSGSLMLERCLSHSLNWEKVALLIWTNQTIFRKTRQALSTPRETFQHCCSLFWDPDLDTTQLYICTFCYQCKVVHVCANLFSAYQICL